MFCLVSSRIGLVRHSLGKRTQMNPYRAGRLTHPSMATHPRYSTRDKDLAGTRSRSGVARGPGR
jgi:hypothetical protein